jgi:hypothetical protein
MSCRFPSTSSFTFNYIYFITRINLIYISKFSACLTAVPRSSYVPIKPHPYISLPLGHPHDDTLNTLVRSSVHFQGRTSAFCIVKGPLSYTNNCAIISHLVSCYSLIGHSPELSFVSLLCVFAICTVKFIKCFMEENNPLCINFARNNNT